MENTVPPSETPAGYRHRPDLDPEERTALTDTALLELRRPLGGIGLLCLLAVLGPLFVLMDFSVNKETFELSLPLADEFFVHVIALGLAVAYALLGYFAVSPHRDRLGAFLRVGAPVVGLAACGFVGAMRYTSREEISTHLPANPVLEFLFTFGYPVVVAVVTMTLGALFHRHIDHLALSWRLRAAREEVRALADEQARARGRADAWDHELKSRLALHADLARERELAAAAVEEALDQAKEHARTLMARTPEDTTELERSSPGSGEAPSGPFPDPQARG